MSDDLHVTAALDARLRFVPAAEGATTVGFEVICERDAEGDLVAVTPPPTQLVQ